MRIDPDTCRDADLLAAEVRRLQSVIAASESEIAHLRLAIARLAEQDATLSVCNGNVTVTMDATLTDAECAELDGIISDFSEIAEFNEERCHPAYANKARRRVATLRGLLERLK